MLAIFDFDGTIADSADWFFQNFNTIARKHRFREITAQEREMLRGHSSREILSHLGVPVWKLPAIAYGMRAMVARDIGIIPIFSWVPGILASLRGNGVTIAIVSSNSERNIRDMLGAETAALVSFYGAGASFFGKAAKIRAVIRKSAIPAARTAAIGDEVRDVEAARAAGVSSLAVSWGYANAVALAAAKPARVIHRPEELLAWFSAPA